MIVKKTKQLGNFKKGINLYVPTRRRVSAAPSGIPASTPSYLTITFADQANMVCYKQGDDYWDGFIDGGEAIQLRWTGTIWRLERLVNDTEVIVQATNNTGNINSIPITSWVYTISSGLSITITAA